MHLLALATLVSYVIEMQSNQNLRWPVQMATLDHALLGATVQEGPKGKLNARLEHSQVRNIISLFIKCYRSSQSHK